MNWAAPCKSSNAKLARARIGFTQKWINGTAANHGVILWATNEDVNSYDLRFYSSENETKQPQLMITWSNQPKTVYFLKDHLGSIRATVLDSAGAPVVAYDDYDPWGYLLAGRTKKRTWSDSQAVAKNKFTGKEWDDEYGVNWFFFPARSYDPEIARWLVRDPLEMKYPSWSPYVYSLSDPINKLDPDGRFVNFLIGAAVGAVTDVALQVAVNYYDGRGLSDIDVGSVVVSAAAGSVGLGLASKIGRLGALTKLGTEAALDATASIANQAVTTGEVDPEAVVMDVLGGQTAGKIAGEVVGKIAQNTPEGKILARDADRKQRIADNSSARRKAARQSQADKAEKESDSYKARRAVSASIAASGATSTIAEKVLEKDDKGKKRN